MDRCKRLIAANSGCSIGNESAIADVCNEEVLVNSSRRPHFARTQTPQSVQRENNGKQRRHADRDQRPDEEEISGRVSDAAADADTLPPHVDDGDHQPKQRSDEDDEVPLSPSG